MLLSLLLLLSLGCQIQADYWVNPSNYDPNNKVYNTKFPVLHVGQLIQMQWKSSLSQYSVVLQQGAPARGQIVIFG